MKEFADDNFKFAENGRELSKQLENTVGKGELLVTYNFSFSRSVFKNVVLQTHKNQGLFGKGLNVTQKFKFVFHREETKWEKEKMLVTSTCIFSFSHNCFKRLFPKVCQSQSTCGRERPFEITVGGKNAGDLFFPFTNMFCLLSKSFATILAAIYMLSANIFKRNE